LVKLSKFADYIAGAYGAGFQYPNMHTATALQPAFTPDCPGQCLGAEPARELGASSVRRLRYLGHHLADLQARACRKTVHRQVEVKSGYQPWPAEWILDLLAHRKLQRACQVAAQ
jgi:hypothetical protein